MPWKPLCPQTKKTAIRLARKRRTMREECWKHRRREIARQLGFWDRVKFWLLTEKY